jgi:hypothetical protein
MIRRDLRTYTSISPRRYTFQLAPSWLIQLDRSYRSASTTASRNTRNVIDCFSQRLVSSLALFIAQLLVWFTAYDYMGTSTYTRALQRGLKAKIVKFKTIISQSRAYFSQKIFNELYQKVMRCNYYVPLRHISVELSSFKFILCKAVLRNKRDGSKITALESVLTKQTTIMIDTFFR